ncbi:MAG: hypothetical protein II948_03050 [Synergistaceae bacterium]|nr:hypothetical protein [Synergistaceae bacterium]MBQ6739172.1 hypothetical protein [Synergistaceae bacterium]MBQ6910198.1 hypothetical protein [Synergistaceae bacterium]MBR0096198.1 hypothetical protein [Synergistaceae bacterium]MBR0222386.1 hypothetical protein [Synergistaceae bacterium]
MAVTLREAIKIAEQNKYAPRINSITGATGTFFPPDYDDEYFFSGVEIPAPDDI